ncbi:Uncharacterised protein [Bordetella pertussis]|nr:Uncharacterised protein [Bordetella pertussis]CFW41434.1 Uncharacterised protein [Bordetella pertussis]
MARSAISGRMASMSSRCPLVARITATQPTTISSAARPSSPRRVECSMGGGSTMGEYTVAIWPAGTPRSMRCWRTWSLTVVTRCGSPV